MAEILANLQDINTHLPPNVQINNADDPGLQVSAFRLIRGQLVSIFTPIILNTWDSPNTTPELIREIAGRLIASKYYARVLSGNDVDEVPGYAVSLYNQAISILADIRSGVQIVVDADGNPLATDDIGPDPQGDVYPNDTSTPGPQFTMTRVLS